MYTNVDIAFEGKKISLTGCWPSKQREPSLYFSCVVVWSDLPTTILIQCRHHVCVWHESLATNLMGRAPRRHGAEVTSRSIRHFGWAPDIRWGQLQKGNRNVHSTEWLCTITSRNSLLCVYYQIVFYRYATSLSLGRLALQKCSLSWSRGGHPALLLCSSNRCSMVITPNIFNVPQYQYEHLPLYSIWTQERPDGESCYHLLSPGSVANPDLEALMDKIDWDEASSPPAFFCLPTSYLQLLEQSARKNNCRLSDNLYLGQRFFVRPTARSAKVRLDLGLVQYILKDKDCSYYWAIQNRTPNTLVHCIGQ